MKISYKSGIIWVRVFKESISFALHSLRANRLRTFLSLLGITIGIFAIISVFTVINSLERAIRKNISELGDQVVYIQKFPVSLQPGFQWWKYINRPDPTIRELEEIKSRSATVEAAGFMIQGQRPIKYENNSIDGAFVIAVSDEYEKIRNVEIETGRFISPNEFHTGSNVAVIGRNIADDLFQGQTPVGKSINISGARVSIIGVFKKEGEGITASSHDQLLLVSLNYARTLINIRAPGINPTLMVKAKPDIAMPEMLDELTGIMRSIRHQRPKEENNFALNTLDMVSNAFDQIFVTINLAGFLIGGFAILVGGFGIANIMFVSVRERTRIIGIQKAIGAKKYAILWQFLFESISLCIIGGLVGLMLIFLGILIINQLINFKLYLGLQNIALGLGISASIGIIAGFAPAWKAANMNPVDAIGTV